MAAINLQVDGHFSYTAYLVSSKESKTKEGPNLKSSTATGFLEIWNTFRRIFFVFLYHEVSGCSWILTLNHSDLSLMIFTPFLSVDVCQTAKQGCEQIPLHGWTVWDAQWWLMWLVESLGDPWGKQGNPWAGWSIGWWTIGFLVRASEMNTIFIRYRILEYNSRYRIRKNEYSNKSRLCLRYSTVHHSRR